jgi:RNA polymerase sigma factor (sigma-70 family)
MRSSRSGTAAKSSVEHLLRELAPRVLGALTRRYGDFATAEDAMQEALLAAATQWPTSGIPDNPSGWLYHVGTRRMTDLIRADLSRRRREARVVTWLPPEEQIVPAPDSVDLPEEDDTLTLLFMCCHPSLSTTSSIALTLRAVGGLTTSEIASAYLVPEATMAQRISRAKHTIRKSEVPFQLPTRDERSARLDAVLHVLYLIFNEGYTSSSGAKLHRIELSNEAIRLTRGLHRLLPDDGEVEGLLALMLLTDARRPARTGANGELIPLDAQDRSLWNQSEIAEGTALVTAAMSRGVVGAYQLQAAVASLHDEAPTAAATDWPQVLALYTVLLRLADNPMVRLSHAIATAMVHGPEAGLKLVARLESDPRMAGTHRIDAVRAHLHEMAGDRLPAEKHYRAAAALTKSIPERNYLLMKAAGSAGK